MTFTAPVKRADKVRTPNVIEAAILALAGVCDGAHSHDNAGYNGTDTRYGKSLAAQIEAGWSLTYKQAQGAIKMLPKYKKQLTSMGLAVPTKQDFFALYKNPKRVEIIGNEIAVFIPYADRANMHFVTFEFLDSRFENSDNSIRFPKTAETAESIWENLPADYELSEDFRLLVMDCGF